MKINSIIRKAIEELISSEYDNPYQFSQTHKISNSTIGRWLNGQTKKIDSEIWKWLYPLLKKYLPENFNSYTGEIDSSATKGKYSPTNEATPLHASKFKMVPVITMASAAGYEPAFDPFDDFLENNTIEEVEYYGEIKPGICAIKIEGDSMSPRFPNGTIVFVDTTQFPKRGDFVVARMHDNGVVFKQYLRKHNIIELKSVNPTGKNYKWHTKEQPGYCLFMWPALEAKINLRDQNWEECKNGGF